MSPTTPDEGLDAPPDRFLEVLLAVPAETRDTVEDAFFALGALAVTELLADDQVFEVEGALERLGEAGPTRLKALFPDQDAPALLAATRALLARLGEDLPALASVEVGVSTLTAEDWTDRWKEGFVPTPIGRRLLLTPSWVEAPADANRARLVIDPGMAFGTGTHETTRSCLALIEGLMDRPDASAVEVLDVGTGTGILAIAALLLGARWAWGIDLDPLAVDASVENARRNGVEATFRVDTTPVDAVHCTFPLVVANILAGPLKALAPDIAGRVEPGGVLLLSGLLRDQAEAVLAAYLREGLDAEGELIDGDWATLLLRRPA